MRSSEAGAGARVPVLVEKRPPSGSGPTLTVAAAQLGGTWLATGERLGLALEAIAVAAQNGVELLAFPETYLSGYPFWLSRTNGAVFDEPDQKACYAYYVEHAVEVGGLEQRALEQAASDLGVTVIMGISERGRLAGAGTVWCSLLTLAPGAGLVGHHRKLIPTYDERLVWAPGDGAGLLTHQVGAARVGSLSCWENWMPQARSALHAQGEAVHVSAWPGSESLTKDITRFIAIEGRTFSVAASGLISGDEVPDDFPLAAALRETTSTLLFRGGSAIAGPGGDWIVPPISDRAGLVIAELPLRATLAERLTLDPAGHYSRPDVFRTTVVRTRHPSSTFIDQDRDDQR